MPTETGETKMTGFRWWGPLAAQWGTKLLPTEGPQFEEISGLDNQRPAKERSVAGI